MNAHSASGTATPVALIELRNVEKQFGSNLVLQEVNFDLQPGEVHALVGENGAGKSTCLSLFYGLNQPSAGSIKRDGVEVEVLNPSHAQTLGIGCVFQELSLASSLSVAENIYAGRAPTRLGFVDWGKLYQQARELLAQFDLDIDVTQSVDSLPISTRQMVEIAKALSLNSKILLLDEPTSALTPDEVKVLFRVLRKLTQRGIGVVYVSHHMSEIFDISDRITVLRDGNSIASHKTESTSPKNIVAEMTGRLNLESTQQQQRQFGEAVLQVEGLSDADHFSDIHFQVRRGEILGIAGLLGSHRSEIVRAIVGLLPKTEGRILVNGVESSFNSLRSAMQAGIGFVPEERKNEGLFLDSSLAENLVAASLKQHSSLGLISKKSILKASNEAIDTFSVKAHSPHQTIGSLSGGNQQKVMLAKWLERKPALLIIEEPTKGVDVGAKFQIHKELQRRAKEGMAIVIISSDFPELLSLSHQIMVVHEGQVSGNISADAITEDELLHLAAGTTPEYQKTGSHA